MLYCIRFSEFGEFGLMGVRDAEVEADTIEEAKELALDMERRKSSIDNELFIDYIVSEDGEQYLEDIY